MIESFNNWIFESINVSEEGYGFEMANSNSGNKRII